MAGLFAAAFLARWAFSLLPPFTETNYEEAGVGLMARQILNGEFISLWWGQPYGGTLEIYLQSLFFLVLGPSVWVMRLVACLISVAGLIGVYFLGRRLFNETVAFWTAVFLAFPPFFLLRHSIIPYSGYLTTLALGSPAMLWTFNVIFRYRHLRHPLRHYFGVGFFCGLLIWQHLIGSSFLIASLALFLLCDKRFFRSPGFILLGLGVLLGSAPLLIWNLTHSWATLTSMVRGHQAGHFLPQLKEVFFQFIPGLFEPATLVDSRILFWVFYTPVFIFLLFLGIRTVISILQRGDGRWDGSRFLWVYFASVILLVTLSNYGLSRYLFALYASVPLLLVFFWSRWQQKFPVVSYFAMAVLIGTNIAGNVYYARSVLEEPRRPVDSLIAFLDEKEITGVKAHYRVAWPVCFESQGRIVASDWNAFRDNPYYMRGKKVYMEPFFRNERSVARQKNIAYVTHEGLKLPTAEAFEQSLKQIGAAYQKKRIGLYTVFYDVKNNSGAVSLKAIDPEIIEMKAGLNSGNENLALDGNLSTLWTSGEKQRPGQSVEIHFKKPVALKKLTFLPGHLINDYPRGFRVETSKRGSEWEMLFDASQGEMTLDWFPPFIRFNVEGELSAYFTGEKVKNIRVTLTQPSGNSWSVAELIAYEAGESPPPPLIKEEDSKKLIKSIKELEPEAFYASEPVLLALEEELPAGLIRPNLFEPKFKPVERKSNRVDFARKNAFLVQGNYINVLEQFVEQNGFSYSKEEITDGWMLYVVEPRPWIAPRLYKLGKFFEYQSMEEANQLLAKGEKEFADKRLGIAQKYFQASMDKNPSSFAYFNLKECLQLLQDKGGVQLLEEKWKSSFEPKIKRDELFGEAIKLIGVVPPPSVVHEGEKVEAACLWKCVDPIKERLVVFVHFEGPGGIRFQADHEPLKGRLPTDRWRKNEIIGSFFPIQVPEKLPAGTYEIYVGLWDPYVTEKRIPVLDADGKKKGTRVKIGELVCEERS